MPISDKKCVQNSDSVHIWDFFGNQVHETEGVTENQIVRESVQNGHSVHIESVQNGDSVHIGLESVQNGHSVHKNNAGVKNSDSINGENIENRLLYNYIINIINRIVLNINRGKRKIIIAIFEN